MKMEDDLIFFGEKLEWRPQKNGRWTQKKWKTNSKKMKDNLKKLKIFLPNEKDLKKEKREKMEDDL